MPGKAKADARNGPSLPPVKSRNGEKFVDTVDPDDPEYIKDLQRPATIKEDLNEMERRKRVRQILESRAFRDELEDLIQSEKAVGSNVDNLHHLEELSELILPKPQLTGGFMQGVGSPTALISIADLRGGEFGKYAKQEKTLRCKVAALYRLVDLFHWSQGIYNHITLRISQDTEHILINPFGLLYHEVSASSLIKVDFHGNVVDQGSTQLGINEAGFLLHSSIHQARPDLRCIIHLHTPVVGAVSAMKCGLLPISQEAMIVGPVSYHDYRGILNDDSERESIARDLGPINKILLLRNHGFVACGETVEEAFHLAYHVILACETQILFLRSNGFVVAGETVEEAFSLTHNLINACEAQIRAARAGIENLIIANDDVQAKTQKTANAGGGGVNRSADAKSVQWKVGELEWEAWMRVLDNAGFRTGHAYRQPLLRSKTAISGPQSEVEIPPSSSAYGLLDELGQPVSPHKLVELRRQQEKARWLNSPNVYQKVEISETGTNEPKKITKWVADAGSPVHSTPIKIDSPHQFSPITNMNPKEFKERQKEIKEARRQDRITAGPQSHILECTTWDEAARLKDANPSGTGEHIVVVGAASKGIIQRDHQHNAQIYRQLYQPNPFANETDEDLEAYRREVLRKQKGVGSAGSSDFEPYARRGDVSPPHSAGFTQETTFDAGTDTSVTRLTEKKAKQSSTDFFRRAKSERYPADKLPNLVSANVNGDGRAVSDDEAGLGSGAESPYKKKEKKKKFKAPSFLKRKKDKKKKDGDDEEEEE